MRILKSDIFALKKALKERGKRDSDVNLLAGRMIEINGKLMKEIKDSKDKQDELKKHISNLRAFLEDKEDQTKYGMMLHKEINQIIQKKEELQKTYDELIEENNILQQKNDKNFKTIKRLERKLTNCEHVSMTSVKDIERLSSNIQMLTEVLEGTSRRNSCRMSIFSEIEMSCAQQDKHSYKTDYNAIQEDDEEYDIEENDDSGYEIILSSCENLSDLKREVSKSRNNINMGSFYLNVSFRQLKLVRRFKH